MKSRVILRDSRVPAASHALRISQAAVWILAKQQHPAGSVQIDQLSNCVIVPEDVGQLQKRIAFADASTLHYLPPSRFAILNSDRYSAFAEAYFGEPLTGANFDDHAKAFYPRLVKIGSQWRKGAKSPLQLTLFHEEIRSRLDDYLMNHGDELEGWTDNRHQEDADRLLEDLIEIARALPEDEKLPARRPPPPLRQESVTPLCEQPLIPTTLDVPQPTESKVSIKAQVEINKNMNIEKFLRKIDNKVRVQWGAAKYLMH